MCDKMGHEAEEGGISVLRHPAASRGTAEYIGLAANAETDGLCVSASRRMGKTQAMFSPISERSLRDAAAEISHHLACHAAAVDYDGAFPESEIGWLADAGLLAAPLPAESGGAGWGVLPGTTRLLFQALKHVGRGSLPVGRLYEGHVNALLLIQQFGTEEQQRQAARDVVEHRRLFGVWNTEDADGVELRGDGLSLHGSKTWTSGAGHVTRPLITGKTVDGGWQMAVVRTEDACLHIDKSQWKPMGMKASASYITDFTGTRLLQTDLLGEPGDYYRQPAFSGGAARFAAVQAGAAEAVLNSVRAYLRERGRTDDPFQKARAADMAMAAETNALWIDRAADLSENIDAERFVAFVGLCRTTIERNCLDSLRLAEHCVGARGLLPPHPLERLHRDLTVYLRQPAPDAVLCGVGGYVLTSSDPVERIWHGGE